MKNYKNFNKKIIAYHRTNILTDEFILKMDYSKDDSIFGNALYLSESTDTSRQLGVYLYKYHIKLDKPLNLNNILSKKQAINLLNNYKQKYNEIIYYDNSFDDDEIYIFQDYDNEIQYGEFFLEILDKTNTSEYFMDFIKSLGYNSFYHFGSYGTDFTTEKNEYGLVYGIYNESDVKFISLYN